MATWNVGGKSPNNGLNLQDFLQVEGSSDVYVLGYVRKCLTIIKKFIIKTQKI